MKVLGCTIGILAIAVVGVIAYWFLSQPRPLATFVSPGGNWVVYIHEIEGNSSEWDVAVYNDGGKPATGIRVARQETLQARMEWQSEHLAHLHIGNSVLQIDLEKRIIHPLEVKDTVP